MRRKNTVIETNAALEGKGSNNTTTDASRAVEGSNNIAKTLEGMGVLELLGTRAPAFERMDTAAARQYRTPVLLQEEMVTGLLTQLQQNPALLARIAAVSVRSQNVVDKLRTAARWSAEWNRGEEWLAYVSRQRAESWDVALDALDALRRARDILAEGDPSMADVLPMLEAFYRVREQIADKAAETRKAKSVAKSDEQKPSQ